MISIRRAAMVVGLGAALVCTGGVAIAQQVPPPGVVPNPPAVPPVTLPPEAGPAGEVVSVPAAFVCSIPGGVVSITRSAIALAGLSSNVDADAASPWFMPLYSACVAVPVPIEPTQCEADRILRANGYGPNGLPITIYFPDPVGTAVTPVEVAEREVGAAAGPLPASPSGEVAAGQLGCEKLQPVRPTSDGVPAPEVPLPGPPPAAVTSAPPSAASTPSGAVNVVRGGSTAGAPSSAVGAQPSELAAGQPASNQDVALSALPTGRSAAPAGNRGLQNALTVLASAGLGALGVMALLGRREAAGAASAD